MSETETANDNDNDNDNNNGASPPRWFQVVSLLALFWMIFGVLSLVMDPLTSEAAREQMGEAQRELFEARPLWLFVVYAIAILTGLAGAIALLMRKAWAKVAFGVSLAAVVIQFVYVLFIMDAIGLLGAAEALPFPMVILTIGILLLWLSIHAEKRGWINGRQ